MLKPMKGQIFFYCEDDMECYQVRCITNVERGCVDLDVTTFKDMKARFVLVPDDVVTASFEIGKCVIRLDETTMKRIAKYNLNEEFKDINNKIKDAKYKSKCLDDELEMKRKKLEAMDKLIDAIWKDEDFEEDNYFPKDDEWGEDD